MRHFAGKIFPPYSGSGKVQKILFPLMAVILFVTDFLISERLGLNVYFTFVMAVVLALAGWFAPIMEFVFLALFVAKEIFNYSTEIGDVVLFGTIIILISWLVRSWILPASVAFIGFYLYLVLPTENNFIDYFSAFLFVSFLFGVGLFFRYQKRKLERTEEALQKSEEASDKLRGDLAAHLHDTIAKDLAQIAIVAQKLKDGADDETSVHLTDLADLATRTARQIRPTILNLDATRTSYTPERAVKNSALMLTTRNITLSVDAPDNLDALLNHQQSLLVSLIVREGATNVLKYAPAGSEASLSIDIDPVSNVSISLTNDVMDEEERKKLPEISGGFGLANLEDRVKRDGGELSYVLIGERWLLYAHLPITKRVSHEQQQ